MKKIEQKAGGLSQGTGFASGVCGSVFLAIALSTGYLGCRRRSAEKEAVWRTAEFNPENCEQAQRILEEVKEGPRLRRIPLRSLVKSLATMMQRVQQVVKQTKLRIFCRVTKSQETNRELFSRTRKIIRKGKGQQADRVWQTGQDPGIEIKSSAISKSFAERPATGSC